MRESFFFNSGQRQLLGVYHPPALSNERDHGIVLCYPFGQEYIRTHRLFKLLAERLSNDGFHVLRFDYAGTGDAGGQIADIQTHDWVENIRDAIEELKESADVETVTLIGLRMGATLAALAAQKNAVHSLVLWDAVTDGTAYWQAQEVQQQEWMLRHFVQPSAEDDDHEMLGFLVSKTFVDSVRQINLRSLSTAPAKQVLIINNARSDSTILKSQFQNMGIHADARPIVEQPVWQDEELEKMLIPVQTLNAIQQWLSEVCG